ncbi:MAG: serine/threonine-protein kinase [Planctomycetota bacterium]
MALENEKSQTGNAARLLFGEIAEDLGLLTAAQVAEALGLQNKRRKEGAAKAQGAPKLGEILVARSVLTLRAVQRVLVEQQRRREGQSLAQAFGLNQIGPYQIVSVLGSGGMAVVYKARDPAADRTVALKVLALRLAADAEFVARFEREVKATSSLSHPHIVASYGAGNDNGRPFLAMEYVEGESLGNLLERQRRVPEQRALELARTIAGALGYAHSQGIIHRDVKPDNVLLGKDGSVKLTDFGLAKLLRENLRLTQSGIAIGTPHYISPEQVAASRYIDHRADLYGLGALLFHLVTGEVPFDGRNNNEIMLAHLEGKLRDPRALAPQLSGGAAAIIKKLLEKKASDRYDTAAQLIEDIDLLLGSGTTRYAVPGRRTLRLRKSGCAAVAAFLALCLLAIARLRL